MHSATRLLIAVTALALLAPAAPAAAQTVVGRVIDRATMQPLPGAFVVLEDSTGARQQGVLSGSEGAFVLQAAAPGSYRLVTEMIGYATTRSQPVLLEAGATIRRDVDVAVQAVSLEGIEVRTASRCRPGPGTGPATARLWEEARKALEVARWSEAQGALRFEVVEHRRQLDARTLRVTGQTERERTGLYDQSPYRSIAATRLSSGGYVQESPDGLYDWYAPDAAVLLSDSFLDTHCFRVAAPPREEPGLIGLGFEPVPGRDLADIEGVLWIERATGELRRLDFQYVQIPEPSGDWPHVGGRIEFERLATGMWIVRRWRIRMPLEATLTGGYGSAGGGELELLTLSEQGAEVRRVLTQDGEPVADATGATLYGTVTTDGQEPLPGASVEVLPTGARAVTGAEGGYRLTGLSSGRFAVRVTHPDLDLLGLHEERVVELASGRATRLPIATSLDAADARTLCGQAGWVGAEGDAPVVVYGRVTDPAAGAAIPGALVTVEGARSTGRVTADSAGVYRLCLPSQNEPVRLRAALIQQGRIMEGETAERRLSIARPGFAHLDLELPVAANATPAGRGSRWSNALLGEVVDGATGEPVASAMVSLIDADGQLSGSAVSDGQGRFRIPHPGRGRAYTLEVEHIGYGQSTGPVRFASGEEVRVEVELTTRAIELDPIVVRERRRGILANVGFYDRLERGLGLFIEREEIERRRPSAITDLLRGRPGLTVVTTRRFQEDVRLIGPVRLGAMENCQPKVVVDNAVVRMGGERRQLPMGDNVSQALNQLVPVDEIEAMEVYTHPSRIPVQYGGSDAACGVIVIWTRYR